MNHYNFVIFLLGFLFPLFSDAQSDSVIVSMNTQYDSINNVDIVYASLVFTDISEIGGLDIVVSTLPSELIYKEFHYSRQDLDSLGYLFSDRIEIPVYYPVSGDIFHLEITPMNLEGIYLPIVFIEQSY